MTNYQTLDGVHLDIRYIKSKSADKILLVWPCGFGDVHSSLYRMDCDIFKNINCDIILYNPRNHGKSQGCFSLENAVQDIDYFFKVQNLKLPTFAVGHSIGGAGILKLMKKISLQKIFLFSPILSSRISVEYMYQNKQQHLFAKLFCRDKDRYSHLWEVLATKDWLDTKKWNRIKKTLDYPLVYEKIFSNSVQLSMEDIAHPGHNVYNELYEHNKKIELFIPEKDDWFPLQVLLDVACTHNIPIATVKGAKNHFFKRRWGHIWNIISYSIEKN